MKIKVITLIMMGIILSNYALAQSCNNKKKHEHSEKDTCDHKMNHSEHKNKADVHVMSMGQERNVEHADVPHVLRMQLKAVYQSTLELNKEFVEANVENIQDFAGIVAEEVSAMDLRYLDGEKHITMMKQFHVLSSSLASINTAEYLEEQRESFSLFNQALYTLIKTFGIDEAVYFQHCSMADANWLSASENIRNPYYGHQMLSCGTTAEIIN